MIALLANVVMGAAQLYLQRFHEEKKSSHPGNTGKILSMIALLLVGSAVFAADPVAAAPAVDSSIGGLAASSFYALVTVIGLELFILLFLVYNLKKLLSKEAALATSSTEAAKPPFNFSKWWWENFNSLRPIQEETNIDLGHDYDGIRELDNRLPPWWLYGFYLCIIVGVIYLYRYHIAHTAPLSQEELQIAMVQADEAKEEFLKKSASKVDENTVTYLSDATNLEAGKKIFITICAACHQPDGGGGVGPNLTDTYWLHGGSVKDIFKTIKYGWPEKGMKSWKDDYSPQQIAQLSSFVKSLQGTKPGKPKEPQGVLYEELKTVPASADSTKKEMPKKDSVTNQKT
jgi:cytochrome c oxidase cbb3-type subunit 3